MLASELAVPGCWISTAWHALLLTAKHAVPAFAGSSPCYHQQSIKIVCSEAYAATAAHLDKGLLLGPGLLPSALLMLLLGGGRG